MLRPAAWETIVYVRDLDEARGFYRDLLGLPVIYESDWFLSFRVAEGAFLSLNGRREDYRARGAGGKGVVLEFRVADVDRTWRELSELGVPFDHPPEDKPWGLRTCASRDPEGHPVLFSSVLPGRAGVG